MSDPADSAAAATTVAEATGLSPPAPEPTDSSAAASADTNKAAADILPGILIPANKPLALNNFLLHPRFYSMVANFVVYPFASGVCYAFGECWARVMMGRWGYLPAVVSKTSGKVRILYLSVKERCITCINACCCFFWYGLSLGIGGRLASTRRDAGARILGRRGGNRFGVL